MCSALNPPEGREELGVFGLSSLSPRSVGSFFLHGIDRPQVHSALEIIVSRTTWRLPPARPPVVQLVRNSPYGQHKRIVTDSFQAPRERYRRRQDAMKYHVCLLMTWRRSLAPEPISPQSEQSGFSRVILAAEVEPAVAATPTRWPKNYLPGCRMSREGMHKIIVNVRG